MLQQGRVSPRNSSQQSTSDKSKKSVSPRHNQTILPNAISETGQQPSIPSTLAPVENTSQQPTHDPHASKVARIETVTSQGYGVPTANVPPKIDEGLEPE